MPLEEGLVEFFDVFVAEGAGDLVGFVVVGGGVGFVVAAAAAAEEAGAGGDEVGGSYAGEGLR